jgi:hypothetical protein
MDDGLGTTLAEARGIAEIFAIMAAKAAQRVAELEAEEEE